MRVKRLLALVTLFPALGHAAELDGAVLAAWWGIPFAGLLLSIALCPLLTPAFWHHHYGKITLAWGLAFLVPCALVFGPAAAAGGAVHAAVGEYIPLDRKSVV